MNIEDHKYYNYDLYRAFYQLAHARPWSDWAYHKTANIPVFGNVEVVSTIEDCRKAHRDDYYGDEYAQGSTAPAGLVFKVTYLDGSIRFYQKDGTYGSYDGDVSYDGGSFFELKAVEKTVLTYERVDGGRKA
ncbi:hypothetical protein [Nocardia jiangxiensis]|uniref:hypothetical protein n=1 Tax=Nocardia jiangxiensis TaxID=282685 RepID=UPI000300A413|nr:hypothetical protein [Nocardia jiangxiensis]